VRLATRGSQDATTMSVEKSCGKLEVLLGSLLAESRNSGT
jgi:hypothetical protein